MINAHLTPSTNGRQILARFISNDGTEIANAIYNNPKTAQSEAERQLSCLIRNTMSAKLLSFLNQRKHALMTTGREGIAETLYSLVYAYKLSSYESIARLVHRNISAFDDVAPRLGSRFYNQYQTDILPILDFCTGKEKIGV